MFSQATDVWGTPQWLFDALDKEFGFTLDPCSDGTNAKCAKFYSIHDSGMLRTGTETATRQPTKPTARAGATRRTDRLAPYAMGTLRRFTPTAPQPFQAPSALTRA
ncbi:MAG: hypothetical protein IPM06_20340 [Rhizobiales bacterium]|nr:hypothetical protein [Hyphomicrobiales bacterium]